MKGHKTELKLWVWEELPMSLDGYRQWSKHLRASVTKLVYKPVERIDVLVSQIDTKRKIMSLVEERYGKGTWIVRGFSHGKNQKRIKAVRLAKVIVDEHGDGYISRISETHRLSRYWFWKDK